MSLHKYNLLPVDFQVYLEIYCNQQLSRLLGKIWKVSMSYLYFTYTI